MSNYPLFRYITGDSKVHLMNSKMKILWMLLSTLLIALISEYISLFIFALFLLFVIKKTNIRIDFYLANILILWPLYLVIFLISFLLSCSMLTTLLIELKFVLFVIVFIIVTFTTSLSEIAWGFENLFIKLKKIKVPVTKISLRIAFSIKFISTLFEQSKDVRKSMAYRGVPYCSGFIIPFKKMVLPIISLSYKLSRRTIKAMKLRFYGYSNKRTNYHENKTTNFDKALIVADIIILYIIIYFRWII